VLQKKSNGTIYFVNTKNSVDIKKKNRPGHSRRFFWTVHMSRIVATGDKFGKAESLERPRRYIYAQTKNRFLKKAEPKGHEGWPHVTPALNRGGRS